MFLNCYNFTPFETCPTKFVWLKRQSRDNLFFDVIVFPISCSCKISIKLKNLFKTNKPKKNKMKSDIAELPEQKGSPLPSPPRPRGAKLPPHTPASPEQPII